MKSLQDFIQNFLRNSGQHVFGALLVAKICAFLGSLFIIRLLPQNEFGVMSIVASIFALFAPLSGFGSQQILLRYGSVVNTENEKNTLSGYLFAAGFRYQLLLSAFFLLLSLFFFKKYEAVWVIFLFFGIRLIGFYFLNHIQSHLRVKGDNKNFATVSNFVNVSGLLLLLSCTYFWGLTGYLAAVAASPFFCIFWYKKEYLTKIEGFPSFSKKELWHYGFHAAATALLSDFLFSADVLLLSFFTDETAVAAYKVALLIPANITFLALTFMQSDFPLLASKYKDRKFLKQYITNYYRIFLPIVIFILTLGFVWKDEILHLFFSEKYKDNAAIFFIVLVGFCLNMVLRNLYGNLLSAVGKMKLNTIVSAFSLLCLVVFSAILVPVYGIKGMAFSLSISMVISGVLLLFAFLDYLKSLK